jgi:hypothetical protein
MLRTVNTATLKQLKSKRREIVLTTLWLVLVFAALLFFALAGHV